MTQQQMSRLFDVPDRTLRDWKKGRKKLYAFLESLDYDEVKERADIADIVEFDPSLYSYNAFWQAKGKSKQKVYAVISNYLSTMNKSDIDTLCEQYGKNTVRYVLNDKYKKMYAKGHISTSGMDIPLVGKYNTNPIYQETLKVINDNQCA